MSNILFETAHVVVEKLANHRRVSRKIYSSEGNAQKDLTHGKDFKYYIDNGIELQVISLKNHIWHISEEARWSR